MEISNNLFDALGMTLIDSLWQGAIVMAIAFVGLWLMKKSKANLRHNFLLICILVLPVLGIYTFSQRYEPTVTYVVTTLPQDHGFIRDSERGIIPSPISTSLNIENEAFQWVEMTPWIGVFWTVGMFLIFLRAVGGYLYLNRLKSSAFHLDNNELNGLLNKLKDSFDLKREILLKESMKISSPMVYGYFKPVILFPLGLVQGLTTDEVEVILLHELAHLKRNDFLINIVINGLRAVYFYHPVFWWLQSQLDNEREFASDEMVMEHQTDGLTLVRALTKAKEFSMLSPSLGFAGSSKNQLLKRVNRIMKKQQKPSWTGLVLPCLILASVLLFTSQRQKVNVNTENNLIEADTLPIVTKIGENGPFQIDFDPNTNYAEMNSKFLPTGKTSLVSRDFSDTITVALATMELLEDPSPIIVTTDSDGKPTRIRRNGKRLRGKTLEVYTEAYMRLNNYSSKVAEKRMSDFMGGNSEKFYDLVKMAGLNVSEDEVKPGAKILNGLFELESQLIQERKLMGEMLTKMKTEEDAKAVAAQFRKYYELKGVISDMIETMSAEEQQLYQQREEAREKQEQLLNISQAMDLNKGLVEAEELQKAIQAEEAKLNQMVRLASEDPENTDPKVLNDQVVKLDQLKRELSAYTSNADKYSDYEKLLEATRDRQDTKAAAILQKQQEVAALRDQLEAKQREGDLFRSTVYSDDHKLYEFPQGKVNEEIWELVNKPIRELGEKPILEVDGKLRPNLKFTDLNQEDILSIQIFKDEAQKKRYPNGETDNYGGIISIVTKNAPESLKKAVTQEKKRAFSPQISKYNFSENKVGQDAALDVVQSSMKIFEKPVIVLDGKFMPEDYLLKRETSIKSINIYKENALKKFPKRKVKGFKTVVEVITR